MQGEARETYTTSSLNNQRNFKQTELIQAAQSSSKQHKVHPSSTKKLVIPAEFKKILLLAETNGSPIGDPLLTYWRPIGDQLA